MIAETDTTPVNPFAAATAPAGTPETGIAREIPAPEAAPVPVAKPSAEHNEDHEDVTPDDPLADDDEALDLEEDGDTFWLIQRILWGLLKTVAVLALLGGLAWVIWGKSTPKTISTKITPSTPVTATVPADKPGPPKQPQPTPQAAPQPVTTVAATITTPDDGAVIAASWNIWLETDRLRGMHEAPGEALLWAKDVESLFETPFAQVIAGQNSVVRAQKVDRLRRTIGDLYTRGITHSETLTTEYNEYTQRAAYEKQVSQTNEAAFLAALERRDPAGLDQFLEAKIEAEKKYTELAMQAEARAILMEKLSGYMPILQNVDTVLHVNRDAIVQDVRVVHFSGDPFDRVIDLQTWQQLNQ